MECTVYIAGPMRGLPLFNFGAFDQARDLGKSLGLKIISPADMDRDSGFHETNPAGAASGPQITREFVTRDANALIGLRAENGDAIALLPGWEKSTGAVAEFFMARWLGLAILDARTFEPFNRIYFFNTDWAAIGEAARNTLHPEMHP